MDWELKASNWDFTELGTGDDPRFATLVGPNSLSLNNNGGDFSVDLKLGRLGDLGEETLKVQKGPLKASSPSGSSKRTRTISGMQNVMCSVDGCMTDLSNCREYHRRHRVCERHSKTPVVFVSGKEQRFCQQCSRFQSLAEFDEEKRSCRKRLDGHNRRRRKPQPEAFYMNYGSILSNHQGGRLLQFGGAEAYSSATVPTWPRVTKHPIPDHHITIPNPLATIRNGADKRFPFLLVSEPDKSNNQAVPEVTVHRRLAHHSPSANVNSHRAHSLLSSPHPIQNPETSSSHHLNTHYQTGFSLPFGGVVQNSRSPVLVPQASTNNNLYNEMLMVSPDDMLEKGASQVLPFSWK